MILNPDNDVVELVATAPTSTDVLRGKNVTDFVDNLHITPGGKVNGTFKFVTGFTEFNNQVVEEQKGYYVPFKVDVPAEASKVQMKNAAKTAWVDMEPNKLGLIWCGQTKQSLLNTKVDIKTDNEMKLQLDLSQAFIE